MSTTPPPIDERQAVMQQMLADHATAPPPAPVQPTSVAVLSGSAPVAIVPPSTQTLLGRIAQWSQDATIVVGALMLLAYGVTAILHNALAWDVSQVDIKVGACGAGLIATATALKTYAFVSLNKGNS